MNDTAEDNEDNAKNNIIHRKALDANNNEVVTFFSDPENKSRISVL